jgi:hypothetical protein
MILSPNAVSFSSALRRREPGWLDRRGKETVVPRANANAGAAFVAILAPGSSC